MKTIKRLICHFTMHQWRARQWQSLHAELIAGVSPNTRDCKRCGKVAP